MWDCSNKQLGAMSLHVINICSIRKQRTLFFLSLGEDPFLPLVEEARLDRLELPVLLPVSPTSEMSSVKMAEC